MTSDICQRVWENLLAGVSFVVNQTDLLQFGHAAVPALHQVRGLLADVAGNFASMAFDEGLGVVPLHGLQDPRHHKDAALQAVLGALQTPRQPSRSVLELKELQVQREVADVWVT